MDAHALKDRWRGDGQAVARSAIEALVTGAPVEGLGTVDGRTDLRGLWLASTTGLPGLSGDPLDTTPTASGVAWTGLDLSGSTFRIDLADATLDDVRLDRAGWQTWRVTSSVLRRCSFVRADLRDASFDGWNDGLQDRELRGRASVYEDCDFTRTRVGPYGQFGRARLVRCLFDHTAFPSPMSFRGAELVDCRFSGSYRSVQLGWTGPFDETAPWLDVSVEGATFESLEVGAVSGPGVHGA